MTIENQQRRIVYDADGVSLAYPVPFPFLEPEWLTVSVGTGEIGTTDTTLVYGVDYEVTGAGDPAGGVVILATPQPDGMKLAISRWVPITQEEVYPEGGKFPAETTEDCFDKLTMIAQQLKDLATSNNFSPSTSTETGAHVAAWISEQTQAAEQSATEAAASADRAAALVDPASLASSVFNVRKAQVLVAGEPGQVVTLDGYYYPVRDVLYLTYNGTVLTPLKSGVSTAGAYSYEEVGADPDVASNQVRLWFATSDGDVLDIFVVASAAGRNVEKIEALVVQARESATEAAASESNAATSAEEAQEAARALPDIKAAAEGDVMTAVPGGGGGLTPAWKPPTGGGGGGDGVPAGVICMWSGAIDTVPDAWALCDGTNGTPDLRDRFVVGAGGGYAVGVMGGSSTSGATTLATSQIPGHTHSLGTFCWSGNNNSLWHSNGGYTASCGYETGNNGVRNAQSAGGDGSHTHTVTPPYYALAYIMKL